MKWSLYIFSDFYPSFFLSLLLYSIHLSNSKFSHWPFPIICILLFHSLQFHSLKTPLVSPDICGYSRSYIHMWRYGARKNYVTSAWNILLYGSINRIQHECFKFHLFTCKFNYFIILGSQIVFIMYMSHMFISHSSIEEPSGCFHFLDIISRSGMNIAESWLIVLAMTPP